MKIRETAERLKFEILNTKFEDAELLDGYTSDLLSDVIGNAPDSSVLITIQAHKNSVAVCALAGILAILICNGRDVPDDMIEAADQEGVAILRTDLNQFTASYEMYRLIQSK